MNFYINYCVCSFHSYHTLHSPFMHPSFPFADSPEDDQLGGLKHTHLFSAASALIPQLLPWFMTKPNPTKPNQPNPGVRYNSTYSRLLDVRRGD